MTAQLPALIIVLPLLAAPLCVLLRDRLAAKAIAVAVAWGCLLMAWSLTGAVTGGALSYHMGGWAPPLGIEYRVDNVNAMLLLIICGIAAIVFPFGPDQLRIREEKEPFYYAALLLCMAGLIGISITGDAFNVFVFVEITSLSSYTLIAMGRERRALKAAYYYLIMGTIGGTFLLLGIGLLYAATGTLNMADLAQRLVQAQGQNTVVMAFAFMVVGVSIKLAVFPLHQWLPNAYTYAPPKVSAFLAATATKVSFYVLVRTIYTIFGAAFVFGVLRVHYILMPLALVAMFAGSLAAIYQADIKRLLAYSSIAQIGYMVLGLSVNTVNGLTGSLVHLFNHALMKGGLFLVVACVMYQLSGKIEDWRGVGKQMPITMMAFVVGGLGLIGVPGTVGFVSKWYLVLGVMDHGWLWAAVLILLSSLLAVIYVWRIVEVAFLQDPPEGRKLKEAPLSMLVPTWVLIGASIYFGLQTEVTVGVARRAAQQLLGAP